MPPPRLRDESAGCVNHHRFVVVAVVVAVVAAVVVAAAVVAADLVIVNYRSSLDRFITLRSFPISRNEFP